MAMKQRFMLDTNAVRLLLERRSPVLDQWFAEERCSLSAIVAAEIRYALERRQLTQARAELVEALLVVLPIGPFESQVAVIYGRLRAALQRAEQSLWAMDLLIASHALALDRTLVSGDQAFHVVPGLQICSPAG
jgi:tRNA(fMet)-specific endonuclease VapC